jgi:uncharacterized membrane protein YccC
MGHIFAHLDSTRLQIALKTCLSLIIALAITFQLDWKPSFMAILVIVLQTAAVGATYEKGILYILGTLSGAIAGLAVIAMFAHDRALFIIAMALLTGFGVYRMQGSRYAYAWLIFIVTLALAGWLPAQNPSAAFDTTVMRASTICLGVVVSFSVHGLLWPIRAGKTFEDQLQGFLHNCRELVSLTRHNLSGGRADATKIKTLETAQIKALAALSETLVAAETDTSRFKKYKAGYGELINQLRTLLLAVISVRVDIESCPDGRARQMLHVHSSALAVRLKTIEDGLAQVVEDLVRPRDGTIKTPGLELPQMDVQPPNSIDVAFTTMIDDKVRVLSAQLDRVRADIANVEKPSQQASSAPPTPSAPFSFKSARFHKAAIGALIIVLTSVFFIVTQWPGGLQLSMIFVAITIGFSAMMPIILISRALLLSLAASALIAAPLYLVIMPGISRFELLVPWLFLVFVPLLYVQGNRNPKIMIGALFSSIFVIILLSLDEQNQSYAFSTFMNSWLSLCGGFAIPILIFSLFNTLVPERLFSAQVSSFFNGCGRFMTELKGAQQELPSNEATIKAARQHWQGIHKQLQLWSSLINHKRVPVNDQAKVRELVESIEGLTLRLATVEYSHCKPLFEPFNKPFCLLYDRCVESCHLIANAPTDGKPVPDMPETNSLVLEIEKLGNELCRSNDGDKSTLNYVQDAMCIVAHMNLLRNGLNNCREKVNAIDWKRWDLNYF